MFPCGACWKVNPTLWSTKHYSSTIRGGQTSSACFFFFFFFFVVACKDFESRGLQVWMGGHSFLAECCLDLLLGGTQLQTQHLERFCIAQHRRSCPLHHQIYRHPLWHKSLLIAITKTCWEYQLTAQSGIVISTSPCDHLLPNQL